MSTDKLTQCARNVLDAWSEAGWNVGFDAAMRAMREALAALDAQPASAEAEIEALRLKLDTAYAVVIDLGGEVREPELDEQRRLRADAEFYRYLKPRMIGADFDWNGNGISALVFEWPRTAAIGGDLDENIRAAKEQQA